MKKTRTQPSKLVYPLLALSVAGCAVPVPRSHLDILPKPTSKSTPSTAPMQPRIEQSSTPVSPTELTSAIGAMVTKFVATTKEAASQGQEVSTQQAATGETRYTAAYPDGSETITTLTAPNGETTGLSLFSESDNNNGAVNIASVIFNLTPSDVWTGSDLSYNQDDGKENLLTITDNGPSASLNQVFSDSHAILAEFAQSAQVSAQ